MTAQYYVRRRKEQNSKRWHGPFPLEKLRDLASTDRLTRNLHEVSEDRLVWIPASQIWTRIFPPQVKSIVAKRTIETPIVTSGEIQGEATYGMPQHGQGNGSASTFAGDPIGGGDGPEDIAEWYYLAGEAQVGPVTLAALHGLLAQGELQSTDLVWTQAFGEQWQEVGEVRELAVPQTSNGLLFDEIQSGNFSSTPSGLSRSAVPPMAVASLVLGILGSTILLGVGSVLAIVFGHLSLSEAAQSANPKKTRRFAIAGLLLGYSVLALLALGTVVYFVMYGRDTDS